ncbi:MAG: DUF962 domain-containing protein [Methylobacterium sp.]|jgi:uncharacterized membrane protein YGL010W|nr:DUF962 domain-containing protein [Methylobacterium sp.]
MSPFDTMLAEYDRIHKNTTNRIFHAFGIPMVMLSVVGLAGFISLSLNGINLPNGDPLGLSLAPLLVIYVSLWTFKLSRRAGLAMALFSGFLWIGAIELRRWLGDEMAAISFASLFVGGWAVLFTGHVFEGESPEFTQRPENLLLGPVSVLNDFFPIVRIAKAGGDQ